DPGAGVKIVGAEGDAGVERDLAAVDALQKRDGHRHLADAGHREGGVLVEGDALAGVEVEGSDAGFAVEGVADGSEPHRGDGGEEDHFDHSRLRMNTINSS